MLKVLLAELKENDDFQFFEFKLNSATNIIIKVIEEAQVHKLSSDLGY